MSGNDIGEEGAIAIAKSLEVMKKGLKTLDLSNAGITPKGISSIFSAFIANKSYQTSLTELTLSNNTIGKAGGEVLCKWFSTADKFSLRKLFLSSTKLELGEVLREISHKNGVIENLVSIDISKNVLSPSSASDLAHFMTHTKALKHINLSDTKCAKQIEMILSALVSNTSIKQLHLNLSSNGLGKEEAKKMTRFMGKCSCLQTLNISDNKLGEDGVIQLLTTLLLLPKLKSVILGNNVKSKQINKLPSFLADFVSRAPNIRSLSISEKTGTEFGDKLKPLLKSLSNNCKLQKLNIKGNKIRDTGCQVLCESLRTNTTLRSLNWDSNEITVTGWQAFKNTLQFNNTLIFSSYPTHDIQKILSAKKNADSTRSKIDKLMQSIAEYIKRNNELQKNRHKPTRISRDEEGSSVGGMGSPPCSDKMKIPQRKSSQSFGESSNYLRDNTPIENSEPLDVDRPRSKTRSLALDFKHQKLKYSESSAFPENANENQQQQNINSDVLEYNKAFKISPTKEGRINSPPRTLLDKQLSWYESKNERSPSYLTRSHSNLSERISPPMMEEENNLFPFETIPAPPTGSPPQVPILALQGLPRSEEDYYFALSPPSPDSSTCSNDEDQLDDKI